jgi:hypothetical protein
MPFVAENKHEQASERENEGKYSKRASERERTLARALWRDMHVPFSFKFIKVAFYYDNNDYETTTITALAWQHGEIKSERERERKSV